MEGENKNSEPDDKILSVEEKTNPEEKEKPVFKGCYQWECYDEGRFGSNR